MKSHKLCLILLPILLLTGCKSNKSGEPVFKKYSNKVSYEQFKEDVQKSVETFSLKREERYSSFSEMMDLSLSSSISISNNENMTNDYTVSSQRTVNKTQYDNETNILLFDRQGDTTITKDDLNYKQGKVAISENSSLSLQLEEREFESKQSLIAINKEQKGFYNLGELSTDPEHPLSINYLTSEIIKSSFLYYSLLLAEYESLEEEIKEKYSFYHDKNVFTLYYFAKGDREDENRTIKENDTITFQIDFTTPNKAVCSMKIVRKDVSTYKTNFEDYLKNDLVQEETKILYTGFVEQKAVKLKSIDTTSYKYLGADLDINQIMG